MTNESEYNSWEYWIERSGHIKYHTLAISPNLLGLRKEYYKLLRSSIQSSSPFKSVKNL